MKHTVRSIFNVLVIVGMLAVLVAPAAALGASAKPQTELSPENRYVVIFNGITTNAVGTNAISAMQASGGKLLFRYKSVLNGYAAELTPEQLALVEADPSVKQVFVDSIVTLDPVDEKPMLTHSYLVVPTITNQFNVTWGLDRLDQRYQPMNFAYSYPTTASNVHAYIIDTGINGKHPDFEGRVTGGIDLIDAANKAKDCNGHGTHVAGTVGSKTYGVAKKVQLHPVRVLDCEGSGYWSGVVAGIDWVAVNHRSPAVANLSLGGGYDEWINDAIENAVDSGVTMVVAAGNESDNACDYSPASAPSAITVGATDTWDYQTSFSNYGACVDVYAPGDAITSTSKDGSTAIYSGTSMASPHVAGLAALYLGIFPGASPADVAGYIINDATPGLISDLGVDSPDLLAYSMALAPVFALPIFPSGTVIGKVQEFQWEEVLDATQYRIKVMSGGTTLANMVTTNDCTSGYCYAMVGSFPVGGSYKWNVTAYVDGTWREAGPYVQFTTVSNGTAFNSNFKDNSSGWSKVNGKWALSGGSINSFGVGGQITSMQNTGYYTNFTYETRMKRTETCLYYYCLPTLIWVRGDTSSFDNFYGWRDGLMLAYYNDDYFKVWWVEDFAWIPLDSGDVDTNGQDWNTLTVEVLGDEYLFSINGTLVSGMSGIPLNSMGKVGFGQYSEAATDKLSVDYATLTLSNTMLPFGLHGASTGFTLKPFEKGVGVSALEALSGTQR